MKNLTKKLVVLLLVSMLILSDAYSIQRTGRRGRLGLKSRARNKNKNFTDSVTGFLSGFVYEMTNELNLFNTFNCIVQDVAVTIHNKLIEWNMEDKLKIEENYDAALMDESTHINAKMRLLPVLKRKFISSLKITPREDDFFDKFMGYMKKIPDYIQTLQDRIAVFTDSELFKRTLKILNNDFLWLIIDFTYCIVFFGSSSGASKKGAFERILDGVFNDIGNLIVIISKIFEIPTLFEAFRDNWDRADTDYERFEVLGKAVAGVVRIMLKTAGLSIFTK